MSNSYWSVRRDGDNSMYEDQSLPFAYNWSPTDVTLRAGTEISGQSCPWCDVYISARSRVVRLEHPVGRKEWVHERCYKKHKKAGTLVPPIDEFISRAQANRKMKQDDHKK